MPWGGLCLQHSAEASSPQAACQVQRHVLHEPGLSALKGCICKWVLEYSLKSLRCRIHLLHMQNMYHAEANRPTLVILSSLGQAVVKADLTVTAWCIEQIIHSCSDSCISDNM